MVEIILIAVTLLALIPILFVALRVGTFTLTAFVSGCVQGGRLLMSLIFMMFTVYAISLFIFDPLLSRLLNEEIIKDSNPNIFIFSAAFLALALVLLLGKSSPFKLYGSLAVAVNTLLMTFMIYSLYSNGSQNIQSTSDAEFQLVYRKTFVIQALLIAIVIFINYSQK